MTCTYFAFVLLKCLFIVFYDNDEICMIYFPNILEYFDTFNLGWIAHGVKIICWSYSRVTIIINCLHLIIFPTQKLNHARSALLYRLLVSTIVVWKLVTCHPFLCYLYNIIINTDMHTGKVYSKMYYFDFSSQSSYPGKYHNFYNNDYTVTIVYSIQFDTLYWYIYSCCQRRPI